MCQESSCIACTGKKDGTISRGLLFCLYIHNICTHPFLWLLNMTQVSEKRWYWLKVFALATIRDWDALEKFSKEKRPPVGKGTDSNLITQEMSVYEEL